MIHIKKKREVDRSFMLTRSRLNLSRSYFCFSVGPFFISCHGYYSQHFTRCVIYVSIIRIYRNKLLHFIYLLY